jgi:hypothetical protein
MLFETTLLILLAILNATIPGQSVPIEVTPRLVGDDEGPTTVESATPTGLDIATISGVIGVGIALWQGYKKNLSRADATADTSLNLSQSLKATDKGTADIANNLASALSKLAGVNPEIAKALETCNPVAQKNAQEWNKDIKQYYENEPPIQSKDIGLDKVKEKLKEVNKVTQPTPDDDSDAT